MGLGWGWGEVGVGWREGGVLGVSSARESPTVRLALLEERVAALRRLVGAVGEAGRFTGEQLLADHAVVGQVERVLQHPLRGGALGVDRGRPLERGGLELGVRHDGVDHPHLVRLLGVVRPTEEEDLARALLPDLPGEERRAVAAVEARHVGVGLLEPGVLGRREGQVAHDVQAVPAAGGPAGHDRDHHLGHEPDQPLTLQDVQPAQLRPVHGCGRRAGWRTLGVLVPGPAADALVTAGAERPSAVLR